MGCATSKPKVCHKCRAPCSPVRRSYSMHDHEYSHLVALTSSTLGSLKLDPLNQSQSIKDDQSSFGYYENSDEVKSCKEEFAMGLIEAKTWSEMINEKIPKVIPRTPITTPPGEPETINAWELMEGLEDCSPLKLPKHLRSFSFHVSSNPNSSLYDQPTPRVKDYIEGSPKPLWAEISENGSNPISSNTSIVSEFDQEVTAKDSVEGAEVSENGSNSNSSDTSFVSEFDPELISTFRKSLEDLPPANPFHLKTLIGEMEPAGDDEDTLGTKGVTENKICKEKLVVYFTSLRGVRKTYEDCCHVRVILKGLGVKIDERDVSMHSGFKEELKELLGNEYSGGGLPRIFLGKKYIGGADEIRRINEDGKMEKLVENCERVEDGGGYGGCNGGVCQACGDIRFVPCETCSGSCKIYYEAEYEDEDEERFEDDEYGFQRCPDCNENGLTRCPICCDY